ncbi:hypothetical protein PC120_g11950 [Phytophthora cactorum]|nr:hypothetical protein PC120_g11950 [Phytophthora cactorum]
MLISEALPASSISMYEKILTLVVVVVRCTLELLRAAHVQQGAVQALGRGDPVLRLGVREQGLLQLNRRVWNASTTPRC